MRTITMCVYKDGKLSGEVIDDGKYWTIEPFEFDGKQKTEEALLERLDIVQIEAQLEESGQ